MNSSQRRKNKRHYKYIVETDYVNYDHYCQAWDWCVSCFGNRTIKRPRLLRWRETFGHIGTRWEFSREEDAVAFALKWK